MANRGRPRSAEPRRSASQVLFTTAERFRVRLAAELAGLSVSAWLRAMALERAEATLAAKAAREVPLDEGPTGADYACDRCRRLEGCYCPP
jgi:hypothetical protein